MQEIILKVITEIIQDKKARKVYPPTANDVEIALAVRALVKDAIRGMYRDRVIDLGRSVNHNFVSLVGDMDLHQPPNLMKVR